MKIKGTPSLPLGPGCFTQIHPVHPVQVPLVHPTSIPVGLTDTLIICLAVALASIDLMKGTIQQNNKRNITTMPILVNHCPQDPKSELNQSQVCMSAPAFLVTSSLRFFSFPIALWMIHLGLGRWMQTVVGSPQLGEHWKKLLSSVVFLVGGNISALPHLAIPQAPHPPSLGPESSGPLQSVLETC